MRSLRLLAGILLLLLPACSDEGATSTRADAEPAPSSEAAGSGDEHPQVGVWAPDEQALHVRFADSVATQETSDLVGAFNDRFSAPFYPELRLLSVDGAVARVGVSDDAQLTEQMGSTGSQMYLAAMTYTLTSLPQIDSVYLDVRSGSHARPGYLSRASWADVVQDE